MTCEKFNVSGVVQAVGFRYITAQECMKLGLTGYAKNLFDGSVEVVAHGHPEQLDELYAFLLKGPRTAVVEDVIREQVGCDQNYCGFRIL
ncbi:MULTISPECIES: acylphosphatase [Vibrio]|uniref:acylphosphatase n=2 Tax=Vibrio TaxID=662 RepID=A0A7X4RU77_9VIBR|nr:MULTISPECIES: acylphosphatase [Vibrio]MBF9000399.1 acylphosphatase [Vibrio nitrifigilis]MZI93591.1 acylphosphatase [Vibrio eleionomae]